jgi:hypothetical protein
MKKALFCFCAVFICQMVSAQDELLNGHKVILDHKSKLLSWYIPQTTAYSTFLHKRWNFIKTSVPLSPGSAYPQYYFYCAYILKDRKLFPDKWMNDVGERIPNWFESARLYYAFTGDTAVMTLVEKLAEYSLTHGTSPANFSWPDFPYTTTNAGDTIFKGFTSAKRFKLHEIQVDHAGEMGLTYYRLYLFTGKEKFKTAAIKVANTLVLKIRTGTATHSVWPYRVVMSTGEVTAEYGANWIGCYSLLDHLVKANLGKVKAYKICMEKVKRFLLEYPLKTGYWADGHSDTDIKSNTYKSNLSASNFKLYLLDHPEFITNWKEELPKLLKWTEDYFVDRTVPGEPSRQWGANIVGEQDSFLHKMDYQTARYAAECAQWFAVSGDTTYKDKAFRSLNWVTYCNDSTGLAFESPVSKGVNSWWSDCYGEGPRMFYPAFAAVPEWAPPGEDHILYTDGILKHVFYRPKKIQYQAVSGNGTDYLRLSFKPKIVTINNKLLKSIPKKLSGRSGKIPGYLLQELGNGDYAVTIRRIKSGTVSIVGTP